MSAHLKSHEIRSQFLAFFGERGHTIVPGSPLVPLRDPSLLFTTAGMVQFKPLYGGEGPLPYARATSSQPCLRATDLERVGHTARHLTFFEMLGNFSFGDYFKEESIAWGWEFLTQVCKLDPTRLWVSIFEDDDEAFDIWHKKVGLEPTRIFRLGAKDNFWGPAGTTGACGPSSEIYWDFGATGAGNRCGRQFVPGHAPDDDHCGPSCDCDRFMEIWNHVFPQFDQQPDGSRLPLARRGIDTGMSIERLATVLQDVAGIFDTDLFAGLRARLTERLPEAERAALKPEQLVAVKLISDHIRAITFVIAENVYPGNEGRGYLVRRLLRRAYANGRLLRFDEPFLHALVPTVIESLHGSYPLLAAQADAVSRAIRAEEEAFARTINQGAAHLSEILNRMEPALALDGSWDAFSRGGGARLASGTVMAGKDVFTLHDTYGFPVDLTRDLVQGLGGDVDLDGYEHEMEQQRTRARAASRFKGKGGDAAVRPWREVSDGAHSTFIGYDTLEAPVKVRMIREAAAGWPKVDIVLDQTPFYAEGGGQVADKGVIATEAIAVEVDDVQREQGAIVHTGTAMQEAPDGQGGTPARYDFGDMLKRVVDPTEAHVAERHRMPTARNHTATHLLHAALRNAFGTHVRQAGSLVSPEHLRFDFSHFEQPTREQLERVEHEVNTWILKDVPVRTAVAELKDALAGGAMALFGEKYDDEVRTIKVADFSFELCGGTHVRTTGEIGPFLLVSEGSVGSGIRRVEAITGDRALQRLRDNERTLDSLAKNLGVAAKEIAPRVEALLAEREALKAALEQAQASVLTASLGALLGSAESVGDAKIVTGEIPGANADALRNAADWLSGQMKRGVAVLASKSGDGKLTFLVAVTDDLVKSGVRADELVRETAKIAGGSGGGKPHLALAGAKDLAKMAEALAHGKEMARGKLGALV